MGNYVVRNLPQIKLTDLLRKRKTTLSKYIASYGIFTYPALEERCRKIGVSPPPEQEFAKVVATNVSAPQEGIVVIEPPLVGLTLESSGKTLEEESLETTELVASTEDLSDTNRVRRKARR